MTLFVTIAYLVAAGIMFWHSAESPDRRPLHRAMLYAFAFALMCWAAARTLILAGEPEDQWEWMVNLGHLSMIAFAAMWIRCELNVLEIIRKRG